MLPAPTRRAQRPARRNITRPCWRQGHKLLEALHAASKGCTAVVRAERPRSLQAKWRRSLFEHHSPDLKGSPVRFARDSPLEEAVLSELVSEAKFPASWENTGNSVRLDLRVRLLARNPVTNSMIHDPIPYASEQGIYFGPRRELNRAIREFIRLIRESRAGRHFTAT